jgi:heat shock protein HslJ
VEEKMNIKRPYYGLNRLLILFVLILIPILMAACNGFQKPDADEMAGTEWVLVSINGDTVQVGSPPTLVFEGEKISGNGGCNNYNGNYQIDGSALSLGPLVRTEMYCQEPEGLMDLENRYLENLESAEDYGLTEGRLTISGGGKQLVFHPQD